MDKKINFLHTCGEAAAEAEKLFLTPVQWDIL